MRKHRRTGPDEVTATYREGRRRVGATAVPGAIGSRGLDAGFVFQIMNNGVGAESARRHGLVVLERLRVWQHGEQLGVAAERRRLLTPPSKRKHALHKRLSRRPAYLASPDAQTTSSSVLFFHVSIFKESQRV